MVKPTYVTTDRTRHECGDFSVISVDMKFLFLDNYTW